MINPTGKSVRELDKHGSGKYGAGRGGRLHAGSDFICIPGQSIYSPISGLLVRVAKPYAGKYSGVLIRNLQCEIKMFYFEPNLKLIGSNVEQGDVIGIAQNIAENYPGMIPHIHLQFESINPELFINLP